MGYRKKEGRMVGGRMRKMEGKKEVGGVLEVWG